MLTFATEDALIDTTNLILIKKLFDIDSSTTDEQIIAGLKVKRVIDPSDPTSQTLVLIANANYTISGEPGPLASNPVNVPAPVTNLLVTAKENANITITQADMLSIAITDQVIDTANLPLIKKVFNFNNLTDQQVMNELMVKRVNDITTPNSYTLVLTSK